MKLFFAILLVVCSAQAWCQETIHSEKVRRNPYYKYDIRDADDEITYYVSEFDREKELPLIVFIQGSGYHSLFAQNGETIVPTSGHGNLPYGAQGKAKILLVEKPGVQYLDRMTPDTRNEVFDKKFSLETWSTRIEKVITHVLATEKIDTTRILLLGHSEGGVVAARVARLLQGRGTHVCVMAGEGPSQLYSLYALAKAGEFFAEQGNTEEERTQFVLDTWNAIRRDSTSTTSFFWGFTYLRWYSFLRTSVVDELSEFQGKVLILQGDKDVHVYPESSRVLFTSLLSKGVDCKLVEIHGADHSFHIQENPHTDGWNTALTQCLTWFFQKSELR